MTRWWADGGLEKLSDLDERGVFFPVLLLEGLGLVDDHVALVVFGEGEAGERRLGGALGGFAGVVEAALVGRAVDRAVRDLQRGLLVRADRAQGIEPFALADEQDAVRLLDELVVDAVLGVAGERAGVDARGIGGGVFLLLPFAFLLIGGLG